MKQERPLGAVAFACASQPHVAPLTHVALKIHGYLFPDNACPWTLESASERGLVRLLDRLLQREWPGFNALCRKKRLSGVVTRGYDVHVFRWWLERCMPSQRVVSANLVCKIAMRNGQVPVLRWLLEEQRVQPMAEAFQNCRSAEIAYYLYDLDHHLPVVVHVNADASAVHIKWCKTVEDDKDRSFSIVWPGIMDTIQYGRMEMIQLLHYCTPKRSAMEMALRLGRLDVAKWLLQTYPDVRYLDPACGYCDSMLGLWCLKCEWKRVDMEIAQWVLTELNWENSRVHFGYIKKMALVAAAEGNLDIFQFLFKAFNIISQSVDEVSIELRLNPDCFNAAATNGHLSVVRWLHGKREPCTTKAMDGASKNGHLNVVQWLHQHSNVGCTTEAMDDAAKLGHLDLVRWNHENRTEGCSSTAMFFAAASGHLEVLQWLHENRTEGCAVHTMDLAARNGNLQIVKWLHENRNEGCTTFAMDDAAKEGHLNIVQYLHENRTEGCTMNAMNSAAAEGHLDIVQYLHRNRVEGCTIDAMNSAAANGYLNVLRFLHENRDEGCTSYAQFCAVKNGHFDVFKWLHENRSERCSTAAFRNPSCQTSSHVAIIQFAAFHPEYISLSRAVDILINHALYGAAESILCGASTMGLPFDGAEFVDAW